MIDIDNYTDMSKKYEGVKLTEGPWKYKREEDTEDGDYRIYIVAPPYGAQGRIAKMLGHTYYDAQLMADAPLLLAEVKRLREVVDKQQMQYVNLETAYYNSPSETEISRQIDSGVKHVCGEVKRVLNEEIKRLREKLFEAELWVNNESYTFENNIKELNDYAEARKND